MEKLKVDAHDLLLRIQEIEVYTFLKPKMSVFSPLGIAGYIRKFCTKVQETVQYTWFSTGW